MFLDSVVNHSYIHCVCICHCVCTFSREKEDHISRLRESQRQQAQQAESALESFKKQAELSSEKAYADMKQQVSSHINNASSLWLCFLQCSHRQRSVQLLMCQLCVIDSSSDLLREGLGIDVTTLKHIFSPGDVVYCVLWIIVLLQNEVPPNKTGCTSL